MPNACPQIAITFAYSYARVQMVNIKDLNIGIIHNAYLKKGGEDQVANNEYQLLLQHHLKVHFLKFKNPEGTLNQFFTFTNFPFNIYSFVKCYRWLKKNKINILHVHNWFFKASPSILWAARLCNVTVYITLHNYRMICPSATLTFNGTPFLKSLNNGFSWEAIKLGVYRNSSFLTFNLVLCNWLNNKFGTWKLAKNYIILTEHSKTVFENSYLKNLTNRFIIKPNFVPEQKQMNLQNRGDHFLFVGRLSVDKGVNLLLTAFENSKHKLTIIGEGPLQQKVEQFVQDHKNVTFLGFQNKEIINRELNLCSALIFPSVWYETFGLIMIEAFAASTPVIAGNCSSASIIIKDGYNGLHFENSNLQKLKDTLDRWSDFDLDEKNEYKENAYRTYLQDYTAEKNFALLMEIYQSGLTKN